MCLSAMPWWLWLRRRQPAARAQSQQPATAERWTERERENERWMQKQNKRPAISRVLYCCVDNWESCLPHLLPFPRRSASPFGFLRDAALVWLPHCSLCRSPPWKSYTTTRHRFSTRHPQRGEILAKRSGGRRAWRRLPVTCCHDAAGGPELLLTTWRCCGFQAERRGDEERNRVHRSQEAP
jgi:hypothetical protein